MLSGLYSYFFVHDTVSSDTSTPASGTAYSNSTIDATPIISQDDCFQREPSKVGVQSLRVKKDKDRHLPPKGSLSSSSALSDYYYNCGYQAATEEYYCKVRQIEEERQYLLDLEQKMRGIFDSYVAKASAELSLIRGENLCDVSKLKNEISEMKQNLQFLSSLYLTFYVEFSRDLKKQQSTMEKLAHILASRKAN